MTNFGYQDYVKASLIIAIVPSGYLWSVSIPETAHYFFLKFCMKVGADKIREVTHPKLKRKVIRRLRGFCVKNSDIWTFFSETALKMFIISS